MVKAIRVDEFGGSERLRLEEVAPLVPGPREVLISVRAAGVNPIDTYIRSGTYSFQPSLPYTPGVDGAGIVSAVGSQVGELREGQRVYFSLPTTGSYAQECICPQDNVSVLPDSTSFEEGAALGIVYPTAYRALFQLARVRAGECVLIHGASGGVGIAAVQFARAFGLLVLGTASTEKGRSLVERSGAHHVLDHASPQMPLEIAALTGGAGPNVILEMLANRNLATDLSILAKRGRIVIVGNRGATEVNMREAMSKDATILAMVMFNATALEWSEAHAAIRAGLETGVLKPSVGRTFRLSEAREAQDAVADQAGGTAGKIILVS